MSHTVGPAKKRVQLRPLQGVAFLLRGMRFADAGVAIGTARSRNSLLVRTHTACPARSARSSIRSASGGLRVRHRRRARNLDGNTEGRDHRLDPTHTAACPPTTEPLRQPPVIYARRLTFDPSLPRPGPKP